MKNNLKIFLIDKILKEVKDSSKKVMTVKYISETCMKNNIDYKDEFNPRRVGHYLRLLGYKTFRTRTGYVIMK